MNRSWETHPLQSEKVTTNVWRLAMNLRDGGDLLGIVEMDKATKEYHFYPYQGLSLSATTLWQIMTFVSDTNETKRKWHRSK